MIMVKNPGSGDATDTFVYAISRSKSVHESRLFHVALFPSNSSLGSRVVSEAVGESADKPHGNREKKRYF